MKDCDGSTARDDWLSMAAAGGAVRTGARRGESVREPRPSSG
jgi:hypothetical protein